MDSNFFSYFFPPLEFFLLATPILKKHLQKMATSTISWKAGKSEKWRHASDVTNFSAFSAFFSLWTLLIPLPLIYVTLLKIVFKKCVSTWALKTRKIRLFGTSLNKAICHFFRECHLLFRKIFFVNSVSIINYLK